DATLSGAGAVLAVAPRNQHGAGGLGELVALDHALRAVVVGPQVAGEVVVVKGRLAQHAAAQAGRATAGRQLDLDVDESALGRSWRDGGLDDDDGTVGRPEQLIDVLHAFLAETLGEHGAVAVVGAVAAGAFQALDQADAAEHHRLGVVDGGAFADRGQV